MSPRIDECWGNAAEEDCCSMHHVGAEQKVPILTG